MKTATRLLGVVTAATIAVGALGIASPAQAAAPTAAKYSNCKALNAKYPGGVAKTKKVRNTKTVHGKKVAAKSTYKPKVSKSLYTKNKSLDRDKDGIACER